MAVAKLVCGDCGREITSADIFCPSCGARIERGESVAPAEVVCAACGHRNPRGKDICESCGASLPGTERGTKSPVHVKRKTRKEPQQERVGSAVRRYEPWQIVAAVAVLAFVVYLVVLQLSDNKERSGTASAVPAGAALNAPLLNAKTKVDLSPLEEAVRTNPDDPEALLRLANGLQDDGLFPRAIETYKKYLALRPKDADARTDLGMTYFQYAQIDTARGAELFQQAASEMETAFAGSPHHQTSAYNLGVINLHMGNLEESNRWFRKAVEIDKNSDLGMRAQKILNEHTFAQ
jgi:tetratricopeptide (TPR) repeat protein/predicted RNA-binding Zn-ribbon protein involved in translation (DUF1610 family)